jgi:hypothetical protein
MVITLSSFAGVSFFLFCMLLKRPSVFAAGFLSSTAALILPTTLAHDLFAQPDKESCIAVNIYSYSFRLGCLVSLANAVGFWLFAGDDPQEILCHRPSSQGSCITAGGFAICCFSCACVYGANEALSTCCVHMVCSLSPF